jgi:hypothetical protein
VGAGSAAHRASCCALCAVTEGCARWVISTGKDPAGEKARCWLKGKKGALQPGKAGRAVGEVAAVYTQTGCVLQSNWGSSFLLLCALGSAVYVGGGSAYGARAGGGGALALQSHPHYRRWGELRGLCEDGLRFVRAGGSRPPRAPRQGGGYVAAPAAGGSDDAEPRGDRKDKRNKEKRTSSSGGKKGKERGGGEEVAAPVVATASAPAVVAVASEGTASAGGGRWVHMPT